MSLAVPGEWGGGTVRLQNQSAFDDLQLSEFIYEQPAVGDAEYTFKHSLTQEVAYNSMLMERRKQSHDRIGAAL